MPSKTTAKPTLEPMNNAQALSMMRSVAAEQEDSDYLQRIPEVAQAGLDRVQTLIATNLDVMTEFMKLVGRIAMTFFANQTYFNDLRGLKRGRMYTGESALEYIVNAVKGYDFDPEKAQQNMTNYAKPDIRSLIHARNFNMQYKTTVFRDDVARAVLSENGIYEITQQVINSLGYSGNFDEYLAMKHVILNVIEQGLGQSVVIPAPTTEDASRQMLAAIKAWGKKLIYPSTKYNPQGYAGLVTNTQPENLVLITTPEHDAYLDVYGLAPLFHLDVVNIEYSKIIVDDFGAHDNVTGILIDRNALMFLDNYWEMETWYNREGRFFNHWLTISEVLSYSLFRNCIIFQTSASSVTGITVSPARVTMVKGEKRRFTATVQGSGVIPQSVTWALSGQAKDGTKIDNYSGELTVAEDETASTLTVTARSTLADVDKTGTATVSVTD